MSRSLSPESLSPGTLLYLSNISSRLTHRIVVDQVSDGSKDPSARVYRFACRLGTTFPFALTLVELLCGKEKRKQVADPMIFPPGTFA